MPTLARLSFSVPPQRMSEFEAAYREWLVPILKRHGLVESSSRGRATPDSIFSRLFEVKTLLEVAEKQKMLDHDAAWKEALQSLGTAFGTRGAVSLIQFGFDLYSAPAGPGRAVPAGPGRKVSAGRGTGRWRTYGAADGLSAIRAVSIFQDREGNLWFGTRGGGVIRYDGKTFATFTIQDGLASNEVRSIFQDREGNLWFGTGWFGTRGGGVSRYDGKNWRTFTTQDGLADNRVYSIFQDREGNLWFGTYGGGVSRYGGSVDPTQIPLINPEEAGKHFTTFTSKDGLANNWVYSALQDREGHLWFSTKEGVSRYDGKNWKTFTTQDGLANNEVMAILEDRKGNLWFATWGGGVSRYDGEVFATFTPREGLGNNLVWSIFEDREGYLWFGTRGGGVSCYDGRTWETFTTRNGLVSDEVFSIFQDREGYLWFGTYSGVSQYDGKSFVSFTVQDGLVNNWVYSILLDREGYLWFGAYGGGVSRCGLSGESERTFTNFTVRDGLPGDEVESILQDRDGYIWFGTNKGVSRYDGKSFVTFTAQDGLANDEVFSIFQDHQGHLWFGTYKNGVSRYDGKIFTTFTTQDGLADNSVLSIFQDREGQLWFGTYGRGVSRYDISADSGKRFTTFTTSNGLADNVVRSIFQDQAGYLWFGTEGGVSRYDGKTFTSFTTKDGLASNWMWSIFQDQDGYLWFGAYGGVSRYDGWVFQTMLQQDGLASDMVGPIAQDRNGDIWFGANKGVTRYHPPAPSPPPVFVNAVVADRRYEEIADVAIPSTAGLIAFEFYGVSLKTRPEAMVYRYRLNGYDKNWRNTHARRVEYPDLPRGTYTFEVLAVDRDLVYSERPATVTLTIHLPYTRIGLVVALGVAGALIAWQAGRVVQRDRRLRKSNEDLRREMAERQRAEEERGSLDVQLHQLRYLYRLRTALGAARSPEEVIRQAGNALMEVLSASISGGVLFQYNGRTWQFGEPPLLSPRERGEAPPVVPPRAGGQDSLPVHGEGRGGGQIFYERPLVWGERERGRLILFCGVTLSEAQERALLDETAGQIGRKLEALELEMQLLQSARLVSLGQMAAGVAHEINQPLGAISATAEDYYLRLKDDLSVSQGQWQEMLKRILGMVGRMTDTVEHLRVFSRDTSQEPGVRLSVNQVIHSALSVIGTQLKNHGIRLRLDLTEDLPPVTGHPHQIEQVFLNLLGNARDALDEKTSPSPSHEKDDRRPSLSHWEREGMGEGEVSRSTIHDPRGREKGLWVRTRCETIGGDRWVVAEVQDNGVGMDEAHIGRVFEPFFTTKPADRGTGLGLSISYAIVRNHAGQIACESRKGEGTIFRVILPASET